MLYLVATPIGHLGDFSRRACEVLASCDYLLCEDTRKSRILLNHYDLDIPLKSLNAYNEKKVVPSILRDLRQGKTIALISDAGTPTLSDPGAHLVAACCAEEITISSIPGACAAITALVASGLNPTRFQFLGFLPKRPGKAKRLIQEALDYPGTTILYESPHRLVATLKMIADLEGERPIVVARELTKIYEVFVRGTANVVYEKYASHPPKGECIILIAEK